MAQPRKTTRKPKIVLSEFDYDRLTGLAEAIEDRQPEMAEELQDEIDRANVIPNGTVPANIVQMGSTVEYQSDTGETKTVTLVFPGDADIASGRISILTPIGIALIGLSPNQSMSWTARDGKEHKLTITSVKQPEQQAAPQA